MFGKIDSFYNGLMTVLASVLEKNLKKSMPTEHPVNYRMENRPSKLERVKND